MADPGAEALREAAADLVKRAGPDIPRDHSWAVAQWLTWRAAAIEVNAELAKRLEAGS